jgi:hypothetical protein
VLGAVGYLWLAAWEELAHRTLLMGPASDLPANWTESASTALTDVVGPLLGASVLAGAAVWALASVALPFLVRGRTPVLDALGALIWAAGLISALRLVAGGTSPPGLLFAALIAAVVAAIAMRRMGPPTNLTQGGPAIPESGH